MDRNQTKYTVEHVPNPKTECRNWVVTDTSITKFNPGGHQLDGVDHDTVLLDDDDLECLADAINHHLSQRARLKRGAI